MRTTPRMTKSSGCPTMPMTAKVVGMTPATTMSGPVAASTDRRSPAVPSRSARSARSWPLKVLIPPPDFAPVVDLASLVLELPVVMAGFVLSGGRVRRVPVRAGAADVDAAVPGYGRAVHDPVVRVVRVVRVVPGDARRTCGAGGDG